MHIISHTIYRCHNKVNESSVQTPAHIAHEHSQVYGRGHPTHMKYTHRKHWPFFCTERGDARVHMFLSTLLDQFKKKLNFMLRKTLTENSYLNLIWAWDIPRLFFLLQIYSYKNCPSYRTLHHTLNLCDHSILLPSNCLYGNTHSECSSTAVIELLI